MLAQKVLVQPRDSPPEQTCANLRPAYKKNGCREILLPRTKIPISGMFTDIYVGSPL